MFGPVGSSHHYASTYGPHSDPSLGIAGVIVLIIIMIIIFIYAEWFADD